MGTQTTMVELELEGAPHRVDRAVMVGVTMLLQGRLLHDFAFIIIDIPLVETVDKATSM